MYVDRYAFGVQYDFVYPSRNRAPEEHPYSYDEFWCFGGAEGRARSEDTLYDDRMRQHRPDDYEHAVRTILEPKGINRLGSLSPSVATEFLTVYLRRRVEVTALSQGCNQATGYPYFVFWFRRINPETR